MHRPDLSSVDQKGSLSEKKRSVKWWSTSVPHCRRTASLRSKAPAISGFSGANRSRGWGSAYIARLRIFDRCSRWCDNDQSISHNTQSSRASCDGYRGDRRREPRGHERRLHQRDHLLRGLFRQRLHQPRGGTWLESHRDQRRDPSLDDLDRYADWPILVPSDIQ
jgi:hypothetical protein